MEMRYLVFVMLGLGLVFAGCSDDDDGPTGPTPAEQAKADSIAGYWTDVMMDSLGTVVDSLLGGGVDMDDVREYQMTEVVDGMQEALTLDPHNCTAHFGMALMEFVLLATDDALWEFIDGINKTEVDLADLDSRISLPADANPLRDGILGHQFRILAEAPLHLWMMQGLKAHDGSVGGFQELVHAELIPRLTSVLNHLGHVEACDDFQIIAVAEGDTTEIDLGEVYLLDASTRAVRAALRMMIAYDLDIADADGYGWLSDLFPRDPYDYDAYGIKTATVGGDTLVLVEYDEQAVADSVLAAHLQDLLDDGSDFLTLRTSPYNGRLQMTMAGGDLASTLHKLEDAVQFIRAEDDTSGGGQDDDLVPLYLLTGLDEMIGTWEGKPAFAADWDEIEDVIAWLEELGSGPYHLTESITVPDGEGGETTYDIDLVVNISAYFVSPVGDWKELLPYHAWLPRGEWLLREPTYWYDFNDPDSDYHTTVGDEPLVFPGIAVIEHVELDATMLPPFYLTDPAGGELEAGAAPYLPDYTLGGLFPEMDRDGWIDLLDMIGGVVGGTP
jgi:hypothetical protein